MPIYATGRLTVQYLNWSWGLGPNTLKRWVTADAAALAAAAAAARAAVAAHPVEPVEEPGARNVITDRALALQRYSAKYLYACHMRKLKSRRDRDEYCTGMMHILGHERE